MKYGKKVKNKMVMKILKFEKEQILNGKMKWIKKIKILLQIKKYLKILGNKLKIKLKKFGIILKIVLIKWNKKLKKIFLV